MEQICSHKLISSLDLPLYANNTGLQSKSRDGNLCAMESRAAESTLPGTSPVAGAPARFTANLAAARAETASPCPAGGEQLARA